MLCHNDNQDYVYYVDNKYPDYCASLQPLIQDYNVTVTFPSGDPNPIQPTNFQARGLYSEHYSTINSVSSALLGSNVISRVPTETDLAGLKINVPVPGAKGSTLDNPQNLKTNPNIGCCFLFGNVEVYFFAEAGKFYAILDTQFLESGNVITCRLKKYVNELENDDPVPLLFNAVLRYIKEPSTKSSSVKGKMELPQLGEKS